MCPWATGVPRTSPGRPRRAGPGSCRAGSGSRRAGQARVGRGQARAGRGRFERGGAQLQAALPLRQARVGNRATARILARKYESERYTIHPYISTETYGRGGFFIHGGDAPGSIGCIDLWDHMEDFVPVVKDEADRAQAAVESGTAARTTKVELTVDYSRYHGVNQRYQL
jgi:hypothetical protein